MSSISWNKAIERLDIIGLRSELTDGETISAYTGMVTGAAIGYIATGRLVEAIGLESNILRFAAKIGGAASGAVTGLIAGGAISESAYKLRNTN